MREKIILAVEEGVRAVETLKRKSAQDFIFAASMAIAKCFESGNKVIIAGNGGSMSDATHFAEEFSGYFRKKRKALPAIALAEPGYLTCVANDVGYDWIFQRGVEAYGKQGDVFISLTTSGNSKNLIHAVEYAKMMGLVTITFLGKTGGPMKGKSDIEWHVQGFATSDRIQEAHMTAAHIIVEMVEHLLFYQQSRQESVLCNCQ